jgi:hypothetical protein
MDPETPNTQEAAEIVAPEQGNTPEPTEDERIAEVLARHEAGAATESAPKDETVKEEADKPAADPADEPTEKVEAKSEDKPEATEPFTEEQLRDPAFFDKLDRDGWKTLEDWNPALYRKAKAVYSALGKANQLAVQAKANPPAEERTAAPSELTGAKAVLAKLDSLDADDDARAQALADYVAETIRKTVPELTGIKPEAVKAHKIEGEAYRLAVAGMPEIAAYSDAELDAAVEADADMMADVQLAVSLPEEQSAALLASVMKRAARAVKASKESTSAAAEAARKAEEKKIADRQARVNANAVNPSNVLQNASVARVPSGRESVEEVFEKHVRRLSGG